MDQDSNTTVYSIQKPENWVKPIEDSQIIEKLSETDFSTKQLDEGRDYCYFIDKIFHTSNKSNSEYVCMAYTLNEPSNLDKASISEVNIEDNELYLIHRISVFREGVLVDKLPDSQIKVLDNDNQSSTGVLNHGKKINITIKDLRLYDIIILEDTRIKTFKDDEFLRKDFSKYVWVAPDNYWAYGDFKFTLINDRTETIGYKKVFFRDAFGKVIEPETNLLQKGMRFEMHETNYINPVDASREVFPFIDFATQSNWKDLANYIAPIYQTIYDANKIENFAPPLIEKINALTSTDDKLRFAIEYVQNNINYIYNAQEMNGHKPQDPSITFENKQGDCKAKSVFLKVLLDHIGVEASVVLVNFNTDMYMQYYIPSLLTFNHVIVKINYKNETYFIDATSRNEFGYIENRGFLSFRYFMDIQPNKELEAVIPFKLPYFAIDEKVNLSVKNNTGNILLTTTYKGTRANNMRKYFKNTNKREILDSWNDFLYNTLNYYNDRKGTDIRKIFPDATIEIISDDKNANEFTIQYKSTIEKAYYVNSKKQRFIMYYDRSLIKENAREFVHEDFLFWQNFDNEKYQITLTTDLNINQKEFYTLKESEINNRYFTHTSKKSIDKNVASVFIEYKPTTNIEIEKQDFEAYRIGHHNIADSNFGLGIDIIEPGLFNKMKKWF